MRRVPELPHKDKAPPLHIMHNHGSSIATLQM
jgi:hypothetical protein